MPGSLHPEAVFAHNFVTGTCRLADAHRHWDHGMMDGEGAHRAARDLLMAVVHVCADRNSRWTVKPTLAAARTHGAQSPRQWLSGARTPPALGKPIPTPDDQRGAFNSDASKDLQG